MPTSTVPEKFVPRRASQQRLSAAGGLDAERHNPESPIFSISRGSTP